MKARKILTLIISFVLVGCFQIAQAQTFQQDLHGVIDDAYVICLDTRVSGDWNYHVTYHLDPKTGELKNLHWNVNANLWDNDGNKYKLIDVGSDNMGFWWDYFNNVNANNEGFGVTYDVDDGWLPGIPNGVPKPVGRVVEANYKVIGKGVKFTWKLLWIVSVDKDGHPKLDIYKETFCE